LAAEAAREASVVAVVPAASAAAVVAEGLTTAADTAVGAKSRAGTRL